MTFNKLTAVGKTSSRGARWLFKCACGGQKEASWYDVARKDRPVKSCGCLLRESALRMGKGNITHGETRTKTFSVWNSMLNRCFNRNNVVFSRYGGRGIDVCERWLKYENFKLDMGEKPPGKSLDRINNNKGYEPGNCRWATALEQQNNTRATRKITAFGECLGVSEWARKIGMSRKRIDSRLRKGLSLEQIIIQMNTEPLL